MNVESTFEIEKNLTLIAWQAVLHEWIDARRIRKLICPRCKSEKVRRRMRSRNGAEYTCKDCRQDVSEEDLPTCCPYPGEYIKCQNCSHFQAFAKAVKQKAQELRHLTPEERAAIVAAPNFYKFEQPEQRSQKPIPREWELSPLSNDWSDSLQLSLLEDIGEPQLEDKDLEQLE